jgi:LysR family transcriptional regulator, mexEF-oprN operon transcriptional activator
VSGADYERNLDLNLLRVFVVVAGVGSVTVAAAQLYLTQPAISAALRRLTVAVGVPLFTRHGRGLVLTQRGQRLFARAKPLLDALLDAALTPAQFDPASSTRCMRLGLSDAMEGWLLPPLLRLLEQRAPHMKLISVPVQFRTVADALANGAVDMALTVADELPASVHREPVLHTGFVCLFDPRRVRLQAKTRISEREYFAHEHVIVSYNGDLRGVVEDVLQRQRSIRCAAGSFSHIAALVQDSALLATVPSIVARHVCQLHPSLRTAGLPFALQGAGVELLWPAAQHDDDAGRFVREQMRTVCRALSAAKSPAAAAPVRSRTRRARA